MDIGKKLIQNIKECKPWEMNIYKFQNIRTLINESK